MNEVKRDAIPNEDVNSRRLVSCSKEVYNRRSISQGIGTLTVTVTVTGDAIIERIV